MTREASITSIVGSFIALKRRVFCELGQGESRTALTPAQMQVLMAIVEGDRRIADIATTLSMTGSAVTQHINQLVAKGIVVRTESVTDRREAIVTLTDNGSTMLSKRRRQFMDIMARETAYLSDTELATLAELFTKINTKE